MKPMYGSIDRKGSKIPISLAIFSHISIIDLIFGDRTLSVLRVFFFFFISEYNEDRC